MAPFTLPPPRLASDPKVERKRLVAERFRRVWQLVEDITRQPGQSRRQLARKFALSERQLQADLGIIRTHMRLPLLRRQGYRFAASPGDDSAALTLEEAWLLLALLRHGAREWPAAPRALAGLAAKLPQVFPPHLQPLARQTLASLPTSPDARHRVFAALVEALLRRRRVRLSYPPGDAPTSIRQPIVDPELILPYDDRWYLLGRCRQRGRVMMFDLANVSAVTAAGI